MKIIQTDTLKQREENENAPYIEQARKTGQPVSFIASDGCEVLCLPDGNILYNVVDWF